MATKLVCDRCGAEINPMSSVTYVGMQQLKMSSMTYVGIQQLKMDVDDNDYELCVSCAHKLRAWLSGEENDNG